MTLFALYKMDPKRSESKLFGFFMFHVNVIMVLAMTGHRERNYLISL